MSSLVNKNRNFIILSIAITFWLLLFFYVLIATHTKGPIQDDWDFIYFNEQISAGTYTPSDWTEIYYGAHKPVLAKALMYIEYNIFSGTGIFTTTLSVLLVFFSALLIIKNLFEINIKNERRYFLILIGMMLVFNPAILPIINSQTHGSIRPPIIFLFLLAIHLLANDYRKNNILSAPSVMTAIALASCAALFDLFGIFILFGILITAFLVKTPPWLRWFLLIHFIIMAYYFAPGEIILYTDHGRLTLGESDLLKLLNKDKRPFFPGYFIFLFGYFGALINPYFQSLAIILGFLVFSLCGIILIFSMLKKDTEYLFFGILLFVLLIHGMATSLGRYQDTGSTPYARYYIFYCWILWVLCIYLSRLDFPKKNLYGACFVIAVLLSTQQQINMQYLTYINFQKADINETNGSFYHDAYNKISFPHNLVNYNPIVKYDKYLREKKWGLYSSEQSPPLNNISNDHCEAKKDHEFIVSEKAFYELKLDGWNVTRNKYLSDVYALDMGGNIIATGKSILKQPGILPVSMQPREKIYIYMIIPRRYSLKDLTLVGGDKKSLCYITLQNKSLSQKRIH